MLRALTIRNVVLLDRLDLAFSSGLTVLTGETGAGKSILLDALGLALGQRAEAGLVGAYAQSASVAAEFDLPATHAIFPFLAEQGLEIEPPLILRRQLSEEGRSRAFINDQPISIALLRQAGNMLVEIEGQFEAQGLLDPATHGALLDRYGELGPLLSQCKERHQTWRTA